MEEMPDQTRPGTMESLADRKLRKTRELTESKIAATENLKIEGTRKSPSGVDQKTLGEDQRGPVTTLMTDVQFLVIMSREESCKP